MITRQHPLSIIAPVDVNRLSALRQLLEGIQRDVENNPLIPFTDLRTLHFARFVIIECETERFPVQLAFSSNFDGDEKAHIAELIREAGPGLQQLYTCCTGFTGDIEQYWAAYKVPVNTFYNGHRGRSVIQIRQENDLRNAIAGYLDDAYRKGAIQNLPAVQIKKIIASHISENTSFAWAVRDKGLSPLQTFVFQHETLLAGAAKVLIGLFLVKQVFRLLSIPPAYGFLALAAGAGLALFLLKKKLNNLENTDPAYRNIPTVGHVNDLTAIENFQVQNQLTHLVEIKPGRFRLRLLKFVLGSIDYLARAVFNKGKLGSIPSIHFARWIIIDQDKRLLFFSNFDGSWENYLGDFIDKASVGLTGVWSNTNNFPRTRNLVQEGAKDEQHFKEWARHLQISTQVWYSAYKMLSVQNINNNTLIRSGLFREMDEARAQTWLNRIYLNVG